MNCSIRSRANCPQNSNRGAISWSAISPDAALESRAAFGRLFYFCHVARLVHGAEYKQVRWNLQRPGDCADHVERQGPLAIENFGRAIAPAEQWRDIGLSKTEFAHAVQDRIDRIRRSAAQNVIVIEADQS